MEKDFLSKLKFIAWKRDLTPWIKRLGFSSGLGSSLANGQPPGGELLRVLARAERVSIRWIEENIGSPYVVAKMLNDEEAVNYLDELLVERWDCVIATDGQQAAVILSMPGQYELVGKGNPKAIDYVNIEVVTGAIGQGAIQWLEKNAKKLDSLRELKMKPVDFNRLVTGFMGNMELVGFSDSRKSEEGLLAEVIPHHPSSIVPAPKSSESSYQNDTFLQQFNSLTNRQKDIVSAIVSELAEKDVLGMPGELVNPDL